MGILKQNISVFHEDLLLACCVEKHIIVFVNSCPAAEFAFAGNFHKLISLFQGRDAPICIYAGTRFASCTTGVSHFATLLRF